MYQDDERVAQDQSQRDMSVVTDSGIAERSVIGV